MRMRAATLFWAALTSACSVSDFSGAGRATSKAAQAPSPTDPLAAPAEDSAQGATTLPTVEPVTPAQDVAGAYLVGCGPSRDAPPEWSGSVDEVYGCALYAGAASARVGGVKDLAIILTFKDTTALAAKAIVSPTPAWDILIALAPGRFAEVATVAATATVAGKPVSSRAGAALLVLPAMPAPVTYLFVTNQTYEPSSLAGAQADVACNLEATSRALAGAGTYHALLSRAGFNAASLLNPSAAVESASASGSRIIAASGADLLAMGPVSDSILFADGQIVTPDIEMWTGSTSAGLEADHCQSWTASQGKGHVGFLANSRRDWLGSVSVRRECTAAYAIYCVTAAP